MLTGTRFARVSYVLFSVALIAVLLKLGGLTGVKPFVLQMAPATPVARTAETAAGGNLLGESLDLPERRYTLGGRLLPGIVGGPDGEDGGAPVFYRPLPARGANPVEPVCQDFGDFPERSRVIFPLPEDHFGSYEDTWGAARPQGGHEGVDLMSPAGTPEFAITDGTIVPVSGANEAGWNRLGGYTVMLKAAYDAGPIQKGDLFYYAHLDEKSALPIGAKVQAGQRIGTVGDTGEGREGTRGKFPHHLHLGWYDTGSDRTDLESGAMNPYPLLVWLEENGGAVTGGMDATYCEAPQDPEKPTDEINPGTKPDLDTGNPDDARPSPAVEESQEPSSKHETERKKKSDKNVNKAPANEPDRLDETGTGQEVTPASTENRTSRPSTEDSPLKADIQEKAQALHSDPRLQISHAKDRSEKDGQDASPPDVKEEPKSPAAPEDKESETPEPAEPKVRSQPIPCGPPEKAVEGRAVHIKRDQSDGQQAPVGREEWLALLEKDPDLRPCEAARTKQTPQAVWTGHPNHGEVWFYLRGGKVIVKNFDEPTLEKARAIAAALGARIEIDDGEKP